MWVTPSGCLFQFFELTPMVIIGQLSRAVEDSQSPIGIPMNPHSYLDVMAAMPICGDLQFHSLKADAVVSADGPLILFTEDVIKTLPFPRDERRTLFRGRLHKLGVERGSIPLSQITVGRIHLGDPVKG